MIIKQTISEEKINGTERLVRALLANSRKTDSHNYLTNMFNDIYLFKRNQLSPIRSPVNLVVHL